MMLHRRTLLGGMAGVAGAGTCLMSQLRRASAASVLLAGGCNADNTPLIAGSYETRQARDDLRALFGRVLLAAGLLPRDVELLETHDPRIKAYAQYLDGKRTVVINERIVDKRLGSQSELIALLGHEVAHFTLNHAFGDPLRDAWSEAAADRLAGAICVRSGAGIDGAKVFDGMAHGGRYAIPKRRKGFFILGAMNEWGNLVSEPKRFVVNEINSIRSRPFAPPVEKQHLKLYARHAYDELMRLGSIGELFTTTAERCSTSGSMWDGKILGGVYTFGFAIGFTRSHRTIYRVVTLQWRDDGTLTFSPANVLQAELSPKSYDDPDELFFTEAFDFDIFNADFSKRCGPDGKPLR